MNTTKREFSAGGTVYQKLPMTNGQWQIRWLLGKHSGYHKWVLPKGLIEPGEKGIETAVREVTEEMGVVAKVVENKPIHTEKYIYWATFKKQVDPATAATAKSEPERRVAEYQEDGGKKTKVFKTVTFYLMEYVSGDPRDHDWEMEEAGWYSFEEAIGLLAFEGEKAALVIARAKLQE